MDPAPRRFSVWRTLKIGSFHVGSSFADIISSALWNRILIKDLGVPAWPVALLIALRYLLAPLSIWAGYRSDTHPLFGLRRLPYIWAGRALMLVALPLLPLTTMLIAGDTRSIPGWALATAALLLYGLGTLLSGSPYLALVRDSAPPERTGQAYSIVQTMLVVSFAISPIVYARLMPQYDPVLFWEAVIIGTLVALAFWVGALLGEERPLAAVTPAEALPAVGVVFREILADRRACQFGLFLALGAISAFMQDAILEPFGGDVFGLDAGATTRFNAYWGTGVLVGMIGTIVVTRRRTAGEQTGTTALGLVVTSLPLALLSMVALFEIRALLVPALALFGFGFGVYTVGAVSLLMAMTSDQHAGIYLGIWSMIQLVSRGLGILLGGVIRDVVLRLTGSYTVAYSSIFLVEAIGLLVCVALLVRIDIGGFARGAAQQRVNVMAAVAD